MVGQMVDGLSDDARDDGDPVGAAVERERRLVPAFRRQRRHAGSIHIGRTAPRTPQAP
jgi:hypothetical protein